MDSFYDAPRRPPAAPVAREMLAAVPQVPEISVLCSSNVPRNNFTPYNQWKQQNPTATHLFQSNKENLNGHMQNPQNSSILKKQVRFESPVLHQLLPENGKPTATVNHVRSEGFPSFERMYMANIPNRQLDLSVIDIPKIPDMNNPKVPINKNIELCEEATTKVREKEPPNTYKEFLQSRKVENNIVLNDSVTDIFNYSGNLGVSTKRQPIHNANIAQTGYLQNIQKKTENAFHDVSRTIDQRLANENIYSTLNSTKTFGHIDKPFTNARDEFRNRELCLESQTKVSVENNLEFSKDPDKEIQTTITTSGENVVQQNQCSCTKNNQQNNVLKLTSDDDFSAKDLLKIIAQQSQQISQQTNQILLLQQQVSELISIQKNSSIYRQKGIESGQNLHCCQQKQLSSNLNNRFIRDSGQNNENVQDRCVTSTQHEGMQSEPKFVVGLTTSFEVSFRGAPHRNANELLQKNLKPQDFVSEPPRIEEITETESTTSNRNYGKEDRLCGGDVNKFTNINENKETLVDASMVFKEPIRVREQCPSPEPPIRIDMKDFEDSDSEDSTDAEGSFYRNLLVQVNKILQKAQIETAEEIGYNMAGPSLNNKTMHKVKEATLKHLRKIGVNLPKFDGSSGDSSSSDEISGRSYDQEDISFAVKQLLMKYLPADHLAKLAIKENHQRDQLDPRPKEKIGAIKTRPEFSFATVQYMKKYNLIASNQKDFNRPKKSGPLQSSKILDISKLKQQPKLL